MKSNLLILILLLFVHTCFSQKYINGPANVREQPNGKVLMQLEDAVQVFVIEQLDDWYKIEVSGLIEVTQLADSLLVKEAILFDNDLNQIAKVLTPIFIQYAEPTEKDGFNRVSFEFYTYKNNIKDLSFDEITNVKNLIVTNSAQANVAIYRDNGMEFLQKTDISYAYKYYFDGADMIRYLIRKKETTKNILDAEGSNTDISLLFYPNLSEKDTFSYTKHANRFDMMDNMLISTLYGCCGSEDYFELATFPGNHTFLEFNNRYYVIEVPNTQNSLLFGFNVEPRYENRDDLLIGELNYSFNHKKSGKVKFFARSKEQLENISEFTPEIKFVTMSEKDEIQEFQENSKLDLWTIDQEKELSKISGTGVKLIFTDEQSGKQKEVSIIAENGRIIEKNITVDFQ